MTQADPTGKNQHEPGAKLDAGKAMTGLCLSGFANAIASVADITTFGAKKYTPNGWKTVPDAERRYTDALCRHLLKDLGGEELDPESGLPHWAHLAWNALAILELRLRQKEEGVVNQRMTDIILESKMRGLVK